MIVPKEMETLRQWICFKVKEEDGKIKKIPCSPKTGNFCGANDKRAWSTFQQAQEGAKRWKLDGVGFCFTPESEIVGIDIDHCFSTDSGISEEAKNILSHSPETFKELSLSVTGIHIYVYGKKSHERCRNDDVGIEVYDRNRFFAYTGDALDNCRSLSDGQELLDYIMTKYLPKEEKNAPVASPVAPVKASGLSDNDIIAKACNSDPAFAALLNGDLSGYGGDHSRADAAFCLKLCFWTGGDTKQIDRLFRSSGLYRKKWDERRKNTTYGGMTIADAMRKCTAFYTPDDGLILASDWEEYKKAKLTPPEEAAPCENHPEEAAPAEDPAKQRGKLHSFKEFCVNDLPEIQENSKPGIKLYFRCIDEYFENGITPGLYSLTAPPGTGKSAFMGSVCDNIAKHGGLAIYFSVEMRTKDLLARSLARLSKELTPAQFLMPKGKLTKEQLEKREQTIKDYENFPGDVLCYDASFVLTVSEIKETVNRVTKDAGRPPDIICIDYVQRLTAEKDINGKVPGKAEECVSQFATNLAQFAHEKDLVIFGISSTARSNYNAAISLGAEKSSGDFEFSCDACFGLQVGIINDIYDNVQNRGKDAQKKMVQNMGKIIKDYNTSHKVKHIDFVNVKSRNGMMFDHARLLFDGEHSAFSEIKPCNDFEERDKSLAFQREEQKKFAGKSSGGSSGANDQPEEAGENQGTVIL